MIYSITDFLGRVDFAPASEVKEILQNVKTIISTTKFSVPLDRDFGISGDLVDTPLPVAQARLSNEIIMAVRKYEPRAKITGISFAGTSDGKLGVKVEVGINE